MSSVEPTTSSCRVERTSPRSVEEALISHPRIVAARVHGEPEQEWGQVVVAQIVVEGDAPSLDEIRDHVAQLLPRSHSPKRVEVVDQLAEDHKLL